ENDWFRIDGRAPVSVCQWISGTASGELSNLEGNGRYTGGWYFTGIAKERHTALYSGSLFINRIKIVAGDHSWDIISPFIDLDEG
ncbi:MAG: hypothetical protein IIV62_01005, partial [Anaerotignum sp.]|nr:hypothetical protein [Anaerotignum sp.]